MSPEDVDKIRKKLSQKYIKGKGLELGALQIPLYVSKDAQVIYVDRIDSTTAKNIHYPELKDVNLVNVDVLDDGELLDNIPIQSQDFIIANHFLEHTQNPILTIKNHLARIKANGILYYATPDKRKTFDKDRNLTTFEHILNDYENYPENSYNSHMEDWVINVNKTPTEEREQRIATLKEIEYAIHFHVWDTTTFKEFLDKTNQYLGNVFSIIEYTSVGNENIAILQKNNTNTQKAFSEKSAKIPIPIKILMEIYEQRSDLKESFPEVKNSNDLSRLLVWARDYGVNEDKRLLQYSSYYFGK